MTPILLTLAFPSAPVPPVRPLRAERLAGSWVMRCGGCDYRATLSPCGAYHAEGQAARYAGTWRVEGREVRVTERFVYPDGTYGPEVEWTARPHPWRLEGRCTPYGEFALRKP
jgi:hypothetical protein